MVVANNTSSQRPIFITGVYRSGTTLPSQILNNHSQLSITYDTVQYIRFYLENYNPINTRYSEVVEEITNRLKTRYSIIVPQEKILNAIKLLPDIKHCDVYNIIMQEMFCADDNRIRWGEKSVLEWTNIPTFLQMFPNGKTIHVIRDPRDVLASYREFTIEPPHRYLDAVFTCLHSMNWSANYGQKMPKERYYVLRHEDVVKMPEATFKNLCGFLEVDYEPEMLDTTKCKDRQIQKPWTPNTSFGNLNLQDGIMPNTTERWRTHLADFEKIFVDSVIGDLLDVFGYQPSDVKVTASELVKLWDRLRKTPLVQERIKHWLATGEGIECYPSDPTNPTNWAKGMGPKGTQVD